MERRWLPAHHMCEMGGDVGPFLKGWVRWAVLIERGGGSQGISPSERKRRRCVQHWPLQRLWVRVVFAHSHTQNSDPLTTFPERRSPVRLLRWPPSFGASACRFDAEPLKYCCLQWRWRSCEISSKRTNTIAKVLAELSPQRLGRLLRFVARWNRIDEEMCAPQKSEWFGGVFM